jgi:hypothetical protein
MPVAVIAKMWGFSGETWSGKFLKLQNVQGLPKTSSGQSRKSQTTLILVAELIVG